jgi:ribosomal-protein-alanine N-acetyltransferase
VIRPVTESDLDAIAEIEAASFARPLTRDDLATLYARSAFDGFALFADRDRLASYALFLNAGTIADLISTGTAPSDRRRGFASSLLTESLCHLAAAAVTEVTLEVAVDNVNALALYAGLGFGEVGRRRNYYQREQGRVDALVLKWRPAAQATA